MKGLLKTHARKRERRQLNAATTYKFHNSYSRQRDTRERGSPAMGEPINL
jgi:hypothetical protein